MPNFHVLMKCMDIIDTNIQNESRHLENSVHDKKYT